LLKQQKFRAAGEQFRGALAEAPELPQALLGLAECEVAQQRYSAAIDAWTRYLAIVGDDPDVEARVRDALARLVGPSAGEPPVL
jgi:cytochrome c-type biogenesis protein CcmH/NrfG